jgi:teichuronic acid biosynthesis glycosyltransferase TuaC
MKILYVVIAAQNVPPSIQKGDEIAHVYSRQLKQGMDQIGIEAHYFPVAGTFSRWNYLKAAFALFWLSLRGDLNSYDLIHAHYGYNGVVARCQFRKPVVLTLMGSDVYRKYERPIARVLIRLVAAVIVPGAQMIPLIDNRAADVIPCGIDLDTFVPMDQNVMRQKLNLSSDKKRVLFPYNPARAYTKRPDVIQAAVDLIEGAEMLVVFGKTSQDIAEYMNACDALAMASSYEGSPAAVREALACNLPIVSVDVGDVKYHVGAVGGCYMCEREPADMAAKLRQVFVDGKRLEKGREYASQFSLKAAAERTVEVYKRVLQKYGKNV